VFVFRNLRGLLKHGIKKSMDKEEPKGPVNPSALPLAIETMLGYTGSMGTTLWYKIGRDCGKVGGQGPLYDLCTESCFSIATQVEDGHRKARSGPDPSQE
jgi:hypothetical protein